VLSKTIYNCSKCLFIIGENFGDNVVDITSFIETTLELLPKVNLVHLQQKCNSEGIKALNFKKASLKNSCKDKVIFFINTDDTVFIRKYIKNNTNSKKLWLNTHGSFSALNCDYILPISTPFESEQIFLNLEHRPQATSTIFTSLLDSRDLKNILKGIFNFADSEENAGKNFYSYIIELLKNPEKYDRIKEMQMFLKELKINLNSTKINNYPIFQKQKNFYCTDTMTRNSQILQNCTHEIANTYTNFSDKK
jgi:NADH dehydrogenase/NADH:ubiquinone oxidoreductase subunit G